MAAFDYVFALSHESYCNDFGLFIFGNECWLGVVSILLMYYCVDFMLISVN